MLYAFYYAVKYLLGRFPILNILLKRLKRKLFFSSSIRFMIEGNLRITHNTIFFLYLKANFASAESTISTCITILFLCLILVWPIFLTYFLRSTRKQHEDKQF